MAQNPRPPAPADDGTQDFAQGTPGALITGDTGRSPEDPPSDKGRAGKPEPDPRTQQPPDETGLQGAQETGTSETGADTGLQDTGTAPAGPLLVARLTADVDEGAFPLTVSFDASDSELGTGQVRYEWSFGDGVEVIGESSRAHTYLGRGEFEATVTLVDEGTGLVSTAAITIDVDKPDCPSEGPPIAWGTIEDKLDSVSGIAASRRAPDLFWLEQDNDDDLTVVDSLGLTISEHDLPSVDDPEDISVAIDPVTGVSMLFVADIGDNSLTRDHIEIWVAPEPDPWSDSDIDPLRMELTYPDGPHDAETLLVDPLTLDLFLVTKDSGGVDQKVYRKPAPHDSEGPHELEDLGAFDELDMRATGGDVSPDGFRIIVRDYTTTARLFFRDFYRPFEESFEDEPCRIEIVNDSHGEGAAFTVDGRGIVTINEGVGVPLYYVEL